MASRTLQIVIAGDSKSAEKAMRDAETAAGGLEGKLGRVAAGLKGWGDEAVRVGKSLSLNVSLPLLAAGVFAVKSASDMAESQNKVQVVFDKSSAAVERWAASSARSFGVSRAAAFESVGTFGNLFRAMEVAEPKAAKMSMRFVELAADLASFNNANPTEVLEALRSGLVGEAEPLRRFGVSLSAARIEAKALELGLGRTKDELTAGAKAQAAYAIIMEDTSLAQGDFGRTSDGLANRLRIVRAEATDAAADFGTIVVPAVSIAAGVFADMASAVASAPEPVQKLAIGLGAVLAVAGPTTLAVGKVTQGTAAAINFMKNMAGHAETLAIKTMYAVDALKAMSAAQWAAAGPMAAVIVGLAVVSSLLVMGRGQYEEITEAAKKWADVQARNALASSNEAGAAASLQQQQQVLKAKITETREALDALKASTTQQTMSEDELRNTRQALNEELLKLESRSADLAPKIDELKQRTHEAKLAEEARTQALRDVAAGTSDLASTTDDARNAIMQMQSQVLAASGGEIGYQQSLINREKAYADLNEAIAEHGPLSQEAAAASLAAQQAEIQATNAALGLDDAYSTLNAKIRDNPAAADAMIAKLREAQAKHPEVAASIQQHIDKLIWLKGSIDAVPPEKNTRVNADTDAAQTRLDRINNTLRNITAAAIAGGFTGTGEYIVPEGAGAEGAIVNRPTLALIGEAGPEALVPLHKTAGNAPLPGALGSGGGAPSVQVIVRGSVITDRELDEVVFTAVERWRRHNGR